MASLKSKRKTTNNQTLPVKYNLLHTPSSITYMILLSLNYSSSFKERSRYLIIINVHCRDSVNALLFVQIVILWYLKPFFFLQQLLAKIKTSCLSSFLDMFCTKEKSSDMQYIKGWWCFHAAGFWKPESSTLIKKSRCGQICCIGGRSME